MNFTETLKEVVWRLVTEERISYRSIVRDFGLDDEGMEELRFFLTKKKALARDEDGKFLIWVGASGRAFPPEPEDEKPSVEAGNGVDAPVVEAEAMAAPEPIAATEPIAAPEPMATPEPIEAPAPVPPPVAESRFAPANLLAAVARQLKVAVGESASRNAPASPADPEPPVAETVTEAPKAPAPAEQDLAAADDRARQIAQRVADLYREGQKAALRSGHDEAVKLATRALEMLATLPEIPERAASERSLQEMLGAALIATRGYGATETGVAFERARALCQRAGTGEDTSPVLTNAWAFHSTRANHNVARQIAEEIQARAMALGNQDSTLVGQVAIAITDLHLGDLASARQNFDKATALLEKHGPTRLGERFGIDFAAANHSYAAWCDCLRGRLDRAVRLGNLAMGVLNKEQHAHSVAQGHYWNAVLYQLRGDWKQVRERAKFAKNLGLEHGFPLVAAATRIMLGAANVALGEASEGFQKMHEGLNAYRSTGARMQLPYYLVLLADAQSNAGNSEEALQALNEASSLVKTTGERFIEAEIHRIRASALIAEESSAKTEAIASLRKALDVARGQGATLLELLAARDLAALLAEDGEREQAHDLLASVYGQFTEGLSTPPLSSARQLMGSLQ